MTETTPTWVSAVAFEAVLLFCLLGGIALMQTPESDKAEVPKETTEQTLGTHEASKTASPVTDETPAQKQR